MAAILKIDINCIKQNINEYRLKLGKNKKFCAVVKADCYGLGSQKICREIDEIVDYFAVSSADEFLQVKRVSSKPILILVPIYKNITKLASLDCEFCVSNKFQLKKFLSLAQRNKSIRFKIHLAINTGMNRFGFNRVEEILEIFNIIQKTQNISIIGIFSHFYIGNNENIAKMQLAMIESLKNQLSQKFDISKIIFHIANTDGFDFGKKLDMVRIGLGMFLKYNKNPISLISKVVEIQNIKQNETVGYNLNFIATKNLKVAVVSIGYADGLFCVMAKKGFVLINGKFAKILAVCMDSIIVDVTNIDVKIYDDVVLIGKSHDKQIFVCDIARWCDTIEYEVITKISKRVKRIYLGGTNDANHNWKIQSKKTCCG